LYGCEIGSVTLREEHRLWVFEIGVVWKIYVGLRWRTLQEYMMRGFMICAVSTNIIRVTGSRRM
jgi:hypothetical protein